MIMVEVISMEHEITRSGKLLNEKGELNQRGYATRLILNYNRDDIKAKEYRIKEWDYYLVYNDDVGVALTIADNSYMALLSVSFLDFKKKTYKTTSVMKGLTLGKLKMPATSETGDVSFKSRKIDIRFINNNGKRRLYCNMNEFDNKKNFQCEFHLDEQNEDTMVIATPFKEDSKAFYYNQKINCMKAEGYAIYGEDKYEFSKENSTGTLDWGRGVWTYNNTWYWSSASGYLDGVPFGFNLGYGFGDTSAASENMVFYNGHGNKLHKVKFKIPKFNNKLDYMRTWAIESDDHRLMLRFEPIFNRTDKTNALLISSDQNQVFGRFSGEIILDDGKRLEINNFLGFAERVVNRW